MISADLHISNKRNPLFHGGLKLQDLSLQLVNIVDFWHKSNLKMTFGENHCILHITRSNSDCLGGEDSVLIFSACCVLHFAHSQLAFDRNKRHHVLVKHVQ